MGSINVVARIRIHEGKLDEIVESAKNALAIVREKDTGTERYDWYLSADEKTITVLETYASSEAVMQHMGNLGEALGSLLGLGTLELEVFGEISDELRAATGDFAPAIHTTLYTL